MLGAVDKRNKDLYSIGAIYGDILNGVKTVVINKANTLGGNPDNDITKIIVEKLNKVLPSLDLK